MLSNKSTFWIILLLAGCIEKIDLELGKEPVLVIDGLISNESGSSKVRLSYSTGFNENPLFIPSNENILGAEVKVVDNLGNEEVFKESESVSGLYLGDNQGIPKEVGRSYQLILTLKNGEEFISSPETMLAVPKIDAVSFEVEQKDVLSSSDQLITENFVNLLIDFKDPGETNNFYRWRYEEVYKYNAAKVDSLQNIRDKLPPPPPDLLIPPVFPPLIAEC